MYASVYITVGSEDEANKIVTALIEQKLIACANLFPVKSYYYWSGAFQEDDELAVIMKTRAELLDELISKLKEIHSYDVPCIVSWDIVKGNEEYLAWVKSETREPQNRS
ncbi:divalent-cation tolerance protein CutA [[Eubacterium] cellulosolvens]